MVGGSVFEIRDTLYIRALTSTRMATGPDRSSGLVAPQMDSDRLIGAWPAPAPSFSETHAKRKYNMALKAMIMLLGFVSIYKLYSHRHQGLSWVKNSGMISQSDVSESL